MSLFGWGDAVAQGIDSAAQIAMNNANIANQQQINAQNNAFTQMMNEQNHQWQNEYNQTLWGREDAYNQTIWEREDNAYQRQVEDMAKAGLNPALANGGSASGGGTTGNGGGAFQGQAQHNDTLPQMELQLGLFEKMQSLKQMELATEKQKDDIEMGHLENAIKLDQLAETERHNQETEKLQKDNQSFKTKMSKMAESYLKKKGLIDDEGNIIAEPGTKEGNKQQLEEILNDMGVDVEKLYEDLRKEALKKQGSGKNNYHSQKSFYDNMPGGYTVN